MSSSNQVGIRYIAESSYGVTPGSGNFSTARFTSEGLSGTPQTTESQQLRTDRMSSGQIVTGLEVGGDMAFELAKESALEDFMCSAMHQSAWNALALVSVDMELDVSARTLTRAAGSFVSAGLVKGDFIKLAGFSNAANNKVVMVTDVQALVLTCALPDGMVDETGSGTSFHRGDKLTIGTTKKSFSMEKVFKDLTTKAINYRGMIVSQMEINFEWGALATGSFSFSGNDHVVADAANEMMTDGRTINSPATSNTLNGSVDMPFLASSAIGVLGASEFALRSVNLSLNNNLSPQTVIGETAPIDYSSGTAQIEVSLSAYLNDVGWAVLEKRNTQESFELGFMVENASGYYGFWLPAIQVTFDDPASAGQNQDILLEMSGQAKVGASGESALVIYRTPA